MPKFALGQVSMTQGVQAVVDDLKELVDDVYQLHAEGDWGELDAHDRKMNDDAIGNGGRIFSAYHLGSGTKVYVITEADRSYTTILRPEEY